MMYSKTHNKQKGFTLLEVLLVVALIAILAGIILVAIRPAERIRQANDTQRQADVATILNAVYQYAIDNNGTLPESAALETEDRYQLGEADHAGRTCNTDCPNIASDNCLDMSTDLVGGGYLAAIPLNPGLGDATFITDDYTGYYIEQADNGTITVGSCVDGADGPITAQR